MTKRQQNRKRIMQYARFLFNIRKNHRFQTILTTRSDCLENAFTFTPKKSVCQMIFELRNNINDIYFSQ